MANAVEAQITAEESASTSLSSSVRAALLVAVEHERSEAIATANESAFVALGSLTGPYRIPRQDVGVTCVVTNKTPAGAYRGFGLPEAVFAMERLMDRIARELGADPLEIRRRNMIGRRSNCSTFVPSMWAIITRRPSIARQRTLRAA